VLLHHRTQWRVRLQRAPYHQSTSQAQAP
jgi:hypothetical protein